MNAVASLFAEQPALNGASCCIFTLQDARESFAEVKRRAEWNTNIRWSIMSYQDEKQKCTSKQYIVPSGAEQLFPEIPCNVMMKQRKFC